VVLDEVPQERETVAYLLLLVHPVRGLVLEVLGGVYSKVLQEDEKLGIIVLNRNFEYLFIQ
jgi:hypothetical protein